MVFFLLFYQEQHLQLLVITFALFCGHFAFSPLCLYLRSLNCQLPIFLSIP